MRPTISADDLLKALRRALQHLYDPLELRHSLLPDLLGLPATDDRVSQLRRLLEKAIEGMKPDANTSADSSSRRYYDLLVYRFREQLSQKEVATDMALSLRHLQRLESAALHALADGLAAQHNLTLTGDLVEEVEEDSVQVQQEIDWLKKSYPSEKIEMPALLSPVLDRLAPMLAGITRAEQLPPLPPVEIQVIPMQQSLLHLLGLLAQTSQGGRLDITARQVENFIHLTFTAQSKAIWSSPRPSALVDGLPMVEALATAASGGFEFSWEGDRFIATLRLKASRQTRLVLVVDDNQDTLLLLERYLANSSYTFVGTRQPEKLHALIDERSPAVILLDVMLPGIDGWTLLSQVRRHPRGEKIPIIISTILPQEALALMLGADAFLKKPFSAPELLTTLDRLA